MPVIVRTVAQTCRNLWRFHRCSSWTSCGHARYCADSGPDVQKSVDIPQMQFLDKLWICPLLCGQRPRQCRVLGQLVVDMPVVVQRQVLVSLGPDVQLDMVASASVHRQDVHELRRVFCLIFEEFSALRPVGRECRVAGTPGV